MNRKVILVFIVLTLCITLSKAQEIPTFSVNNNVTIEHSVRLNGAPITASCNLTVFNKINVPIISFAPMTYNVGSQTYTFTIFPQNLTDKGIYNYDITCLNINGNASESFQFQITEDGTRPSVTEGIAYLFLLIIGIGLFIYLIWCYLRTDSSAYTNEEGQLIKINKKKYLKMFLFAMSYIIAAWIMFAAWNLAAIYINNRTIGAIFYTLQIGMLKLIYPFIIVWGLVTFIVWAKDLRLENKAKKGELIYVK